MENQFTPGDFGEPCPSCGSYHRQKERFIREAAIEMMDCMCLHCGRQWRTKTKDSTQSVTAFIRHLEYVAAVSDFIKRSDFTPEVQKILYAKLREIEKGGID